MSLMLAVSLIPIIATIIAGAFGTYKTDTLAGILIIVGGLWWMLWTSVAIIWLLLK